MANLFSAHNFSLCYGKKRILENLDFAIDEHELLFLLGPNGSGKSTLLKSLLRIGENCQISGSLCLWEKPIAEYSRMELARLISHIPQPGMALPPFTVQELLEASLYAQKMGQRSENFQQQIEDALARLNLLTQKNCQLPRLSGGERQRVFIAAALAQQTPAILMDEPETFLDPVHILEVRKLIRELHGKKRCLVIVTHNISFPLQTDGKVLLLKKGKCVFFGDTANLAGKPQILEEIYDCHFHFISHPLTGRPIALI